MLRFLVFTDLHYDDVDDGDKRIRELLDKARYQYTIQLVIMILKVMTLRIRLSSYLMTNHIMHLLVVIISLLF